MDLKKIGAKALKVAIPVLALATSYIADRFADKERDEKFVSKEELNELLKDKKES